MRVITGPRQSGKTTEAIKEADRTGSILLVQSHAAVSQVESQAADMGVDIEVQTYRDLINGRLLGSHPDVVIDNLDMFVQILALAHGAESVKSVTITSGEQINLAKE